MGRMSFFWVDSRAEFCVISFFERSPDERSSTSFLLLKVKTPNILASNQIQTDVSEIIKRGSYTQRIIASRYQIEKEGVKRSSQRKLKG